MIGKNLIYLRKENKLKQSEMLTLFGVQNFTWSDYERGKSTPPIDLLFKISDYFQIDVRELVKTDLENVHLNKKEDIKNNGENVHLNVHQRVHLNVENGQKEEKQTLVVNLMPKVVTVDSRGEDNMVLVPVKAAAGYLNGYGDQAFIQTLPAYRLPGYNNGIYRMFEVAGLSMHPTLNDGDILITRAVETLDGIVNDRIHVVVTLNDGIVVKRVLNRVQTDNKLILKSDNIKDKHEYPNMVLDPSEVREIWFVVACISRIMKSPTEMYERITNVEGELTIVLDKLRKAGL